LKRDLLYATGNTDPPICLFRKRRPSEAMRLLNTRTLQMREFFGGIVPPYAILSHTWEAEEVTFDEFHSPSSKAKAGFKKIEQCCNQASQHDLQWVWVDTLCIDKSSSAELTEAINSMFRWYKKASYCYAYLSDVESPRDNAGLDSQVRNFEPFRTAFRASRWFTRGWTLQELIAPHKVLFFCSDWTEIGTREAISDIIAEITGIDESILKGRDFHQASIAKRMSWASGRKTTRMEDMAYCLFGLFSVNMPLLYGEGERAFLRLQEEIMKTSDDESIFAWSISAADSAEPLLTGLLARSPAEFAHSGNIIPLSRPKSSEPYSMTNKGLRIQLPLLADSLDPHNYVALLSCQIKDNFTGPIAIRLRRRPFMEDRFMRMAELPAFIFGADKELRTRFHSPQSDKRVIYVQSTIYLPDEARKKVHFQVRSIPAGFRITEGYPDWTWNEEAHFLAATDQNRIAKAAIQLEERNGTNRLVAMLAIEPGTVGSVGSGSSFHIRLVHRDIEDPLQLVCDEYTPAANEWFVEKGEDCLGIFREDSSKERIRATVEERIVLGLQVYQVEIRSEPVVIGMSQPRRNWYVSWLVETVWKWVKVCRSLGLTRKSKLCTDEEDIELAELLTP
jgi:heterokaryon incompatibility protein (HET)